MDRSEKLKAFFSEEHKFKKEVKKLREILLKSDLEETYKWNFPTYTLDNKNIVAIGKFKNHFGVWFFNGAFLSDPYQVLENAQEGKTMVMRHWKFYNENEIDEKKISQYLSEAIKNQKKGTSLTTSRKKKSTKLELPDLLIKAFNANPEAKKAFNVLTPYKQKEYVEYIEEAKLEKTKISRLAKILPMILEGKGLNDKYR
ncbi:YdeI/OmpD-associated family protein [Maribacter cobaltidurans]|uniref:Uncharacterized protein n=1 Tax=Maribacter cobaltidurans TaxID=1178778 RepID=A0A223V145_9FLAO|nr:DUF1801 domain-containing protein [Maribacter cobaltidurans]ASV29115.1 hypothetical protein CJ263_02120 [Maribacter cobaltidurans]GGD71779.1 hypothetical protein GCM10011412_06730 [Maribacter cobaltidurans]